MLGGGLLVVLLLAAALGTVRMNQFLDAPAVPDGDANFVIDAGTSFGSVAAALEAQGVIMPTG